MHALRAAAVAVLSTVVLVGCGPSGAGGGDDAPPKASPEPGTSASTTASADPSPGGSTGPGTSTGATADPSTSPTAGRVPAPGETLVRVTRTGGIAGRTHTLVVKGDGSWTQVDVKGRPTSTGKLSAAELAALRTSLREADFARLPRFVTGGPTIFDGYFYAFVHDGHEVAGDQESLPAALMRVLAALPPFTGGEANP
ncbi:MULTISPECIES: hypothetical protein [unclassified Streptomyces]|uniref:hypothetical protein n=1 Tax=unclassified Streptomyces TaxID=2593676 RepID=UPI00131C93FA|nr:MULTISPECIES: hypothetical protein [unclassified Streptomyces]